MFSQRNDLKAARISFEKSSGCSHARIEKLDLESPFPDGRRLANQLVEPLLDGGAVTPVVNVESMSIARRQAIEENVKSNGGGRRGASHHQVEVSCLQLVHDAACGVVQNNSLTFEPPFAGQCPLIER